MAPELAKIRVAVIPERNGQLLRRALQQRLQGRNGALAAEYDLRVSLAYDTEVQGFRRDGVPSRVRTTAIGSWALFTLAVPPQPIAQGSERTFDAYNIPENEFFAADAARETMERRLLDQLAFVITQRLALHLRERASAGAPA